jgi:hypothetical protein
MATVQEFKQLISRIEGIKSYIFVRNDGHVVLHNSEAPDILASMVAFNGLTCDTMKSVIGTTFFKYLMITRKNNEKFFIFPAGPYFLGVLLDATAYSGDVVQKLLKLLRLENRGPA